MKSQDILLLFKLVCLHKAEYVSSKANRKTGSQSLESEARYKDQSLDNSAYTTRALENSTGISRSQVSLSIQRCADVGLLRTDRNSGAPRVNRKALFEFAVYGLKYVFPAKPAEITRGIATAFAAPVLRDLLMSGGDLVPVWPDAQGETKGQAVEPIYKSVVHAVRLDSELYAMLALVDAIRIGMPREAKLAKRLLAEYLEV